MSEVLKVSVAPPTLQVRDPHRDFFYVPMSPEIIEELSENWSRPVQMKYENGQLILRDVQGD